MQYCIGEAWCFLQLGGKEICAISVLALTNSQNELSWILAKIQCRVALHPGPFKLRIPFCGIMQLGSSFNVTFILKAFFYKDFRGMTGAASPDALCILPNCHLFHVPHLGNALGKFVVKAH